MCAESNCYVTVPRNNPGPRGRDGPNASSIIKIALVLPERRGRRQRHTASHARLRGRAHARYEVLVACRMIAGLPSAGQSSPRANARGAGAADAITCLSFPVTTSHHAERLDHAPLSTTHQAARMCTRLSNDALGLSPRLRVSYLPSSSSPSATRFSNDAGLRLTPASLMRDAGLSCRTGVYLFRRRCH